MAEGVWEAGAKLNYSLVVIPFSILKKTIWACQEWAMSTDVFLRQGYVGNEPNCSLKHVFLKQETGFPQD